MIARSFLLHDFPLLRGPLQIDIRPVAAKIPLLSFNHAATQRSFEKTAIGMKAENLPHHVRNVCGYCGIFHEAAAQQSLYAIQSATNQDTMPDSPNFLREATILHHAQRVYGAYLPIQLGLNSILDFHGSNKTHREQYAHLLRLVKAAMKGQKVLQLEKEIKKAKQGVRAAMEALAVEKKDSELPNQMSALQYSPANPFRGPLRWLKKGKMETNASKEMSQLKKLFESGGHQGEETPFVGPVARFSLNKDSWNGATKEMVRLYFQNEKKPTLFDAPLIRALELWQHLDEWENQPSPPKEGSNWAKEKDLKGEGMGLIESPDGPLIYHVKVDGRQNIESLKIITPAHQNEYWLNEYLQQAAANQNPKTENDWKKCVSPVLYAFDPCPCCMGRPF